MKTRKTSLLKWVAMIELVIGAYNLMTGLMSAYVLITDLEGVMASLAESGIEYSAGILGASVAITSIGGLLMVLAGVVGMIFGALPGKQKLPVYCGYGLLAFVGPFRYHTGGFFGKRYRTVHAVPLCDPRLLSVGSYEK